MIDALTLLSTRRSVPANTLKAPGPDAVQLDTMFRIASRVPDHAKLVPWRFIVYPQGEGARIGDWLVARAGVIMPDMPAPRIEQTRTRFSLAPLVVGVLSGPKESPKAPAWEQELSAGAACMNFVHAAHALGFAAQWITEWYAFDAEAARYLGARDGERFAAFIHVGTPAESPTERDRPALADIVSTWSA
jgi:nitroreductase